MSTTPPPEIATLPSTAAMIDALRGAAPRRWVVTGAAGFIGSHLCEALLAGGQEVVAIDDLSAGRRENLRDAAARAGAGAEARLEFHELDVCDGPRVRALCEGAHHLLHQAAVASVPRSMATPALHHRANTEGFFQVLEAARDAGVDSLVYASSSSVYGDHPALPKREEDTGEPLSPYAATKATNEVYAAAWSRAFGLRAIGLRYFNVFGPRQDPEGAYAAVIPRWIDTLLRGEAPEIYGDGSNSRDFCPVANVVQANLRAALCVRAPRARVFNVALGQRTTLIELFAALRELLVELGAPCAEVAAAHRDPRPGDIAHSLADIGRARAQLGYRPEVALRDALRDTAAWFLERVDR